MVLERQFFQPSFEPALPSKSFSSADIQALHASLVAELPHHCRVQGWHEVLSFPTFVTSDQYPQMIGCSRQFGSSYSSTIDALWIERWIGGAEEVSCSSSPAAGVWEGTRATEHAKPCLQMWTLILISNE